jgi:hypothetical protein
MSVVRRGARCGGRGCGRTYPHARRPKPCVARWAGRPTRVVDSKVTPPGPSRSKPHTPRAERRSVRLSCGDVLMCFVYTTRTWGRGRGQTPGVPRALFGGNEGTETRAHPGADQTTRAAKRWLIPLEPRLSIPCGHSSLRRRPRAGGDPATAGVWICFVAFAPRNDGERQERPPLTVR